MERNVRRILSLCRRLILIFSFMEALIIFIEAFLLYPSNTLKPSAEDIEITKKLKDAGDLLGISVLDHLIITKKDCFSFKRNGIVF